MRNQEAFKSDKRRTFETALAEAVRNKEFLLAKDIQAEMDKFVEADVKICLYGIG